MFLLSIRSSRPSLLAPHSPLTYVHSLLALAGHVEADPPLPLCVEEDVVHLAEPGHGAVHLYGMGCIEGVGMGIEVELADGGIAKGAVLVHDSVGRTEGGGEG